MINEILSSTIGSNKTSRDEMYAALGELISEDNFEMLASTQVFESLKYVFAVEDFEVFAAFMEDMNIMLNEQTAA